MSIAKYLNHFIFNYHLRVKRKLNKTITQLKYISAISILALNL